jgi:hypothetical protein
MAFPAVGDLFHAQFLSPSHLEPLDVSDPDRSRFVLITGGGESDGGGARPSDGPPYRTPGRDVDFSECRKVALDGRASLGDRVRAIQDLGKAKLAEEVESAFSCLMRLIEKSALDFFPSPWTIFFARNFDEKFGSRLLNMHAHAALARLAPDLSADQRKELFRAVLDTCMRYPNKGTLLHLDEDWPESDPHRVAPYWIDLERPQRILLNEVLEVLTRDWVSLHPEIADDAVLQIRIAHAMAVLREKELAVRKHVLSTPSEPRERNWIERNSWVRAGGAAAIVGAAAAYAKIQDPWIMIPSVAVLGVSSLLGFYAVYRENSSASEQLSYFIERNRDHYLALGIRPAPSESSQKVRVEIEREDKRDEGEEVLVGKIKKEEKR